MSDCGNLQFDLSFKILGIEELLNKDWYFNPVCLICLVEKRKLVNIPD